MSTILSTTFMGHDCIGRVIDGRFTLLRWLGGTEHSSVFLTELEGDSPGKAAIKLCRADEMDAEARIAQWELARGLSHPHLMRIFDAGRCRLAGEDLLYVVTEYADEILSEILRQRPLTAEETSEMLDPVVEVLSFLHGQNLVHGHPKPSNIMVVNDRLKLSADRLQSAGQCIWAFLSSDPYVAPETFVHRKISPAADVWSLGVVMVETFTQRPPLGNGSAGRELVVPRSIPRNFFDLASKCLRVNPARRWTLSKIVDSLHPAQVAQPSGSASRTQPSWARMTFAGIVFVAVGVSAAVVLGSHHGLRPPELQPSSSLASTQPEPPIPAAEPQPASTTVKPQPPVAAAKAQPPVSAAEPQFSASAEPRPAAVARSQESIARGAVVKGAVIDQPTPDVPQHIIDTIQGHLHVRIRVQVDASGNVADAALDSPGPSRYFANKALDTARKWKFTPATIDGSPAASTWILEFIFSQSETRITSTETSP
jgi:TonB family protein